LQENEITPECPLVVQHLGDENSLNRKLWTKYGNSYSEGGSMGVVNDDAYFVDGEEYEGGVLQRLATATRVIRNTGPSTEFHASGPCDVL
jgi:hypothetical protein